MPEERQKHLGREFEIALGSHRELNSGKDHNLNLNLGVR